MMEIEGEIRTRHRQPENVAAALRPDNLSSMHTMPEVDEVVCWIRGNSLRSVIASVDDYLMNLRVAEELCGCISK